MKTKVIVTRDCDGCVAIWPLTTKPVKNSDGKWWDCSGCCIVDGDECLMKSFKAILGFTPRKGSKEVLEISIKRKK